MKIIRKADVGEKQVPVLYDLTYGVTFMFVDYDLSTGPFLVIEPMGYCHSRIKHRKPKVFTLNLATNRISLRAVDARVRVVECAVVVGNSEGVI